MDFYRNKTFVEKYNYLKGLYSKEIQNAILLYGSHRNYSFFLTIEFLKSIYCEKKTDFSCNNCSQCKLISEFIHPNVKIIFPMVNETEEFNKNINALFNKTFSENICIDQDIWRNNLKSQNKQMIINKNSISDIINFMNINSFNEKPKICMIWLPELLNKSSANSLLKILEEPVQNSSFILISNDIDNIIPTIKSRSIKIFIEDIIFDDIACDFDNIIIFFRICYSFKCEEISIFINKTYENGRFYIIKFLTDCISFLNKILYNILDVNVQIQNEEIDKINKLKNVFDICKIEKIYTCINKTIELIRRNVNIKITLFNLMKEINSKIKKI